MKLTRSLLAVAISLSFISSFVIVAPPHVAIAQDQLAALQRGYRTGYSDGYMSGYRDSIDNTTKSYLRHDEYTTANRAFSSAYGSVNDYKDGYKQGFEAGYDTGFDKRPFESAVPHDLRFRGDIAVTTSAETPAGASVETIEDPVVDSTSREVDNNANSAVESQPVAEAIHQASFQPVSDAVIIIPRDTELVLELTTPLSTEKNREGDSFTAKILSPTEIAGGIIEGRIDKVQKPGRIKRRSAMLLSFDRIVLTESRWSNFDAILTEVLAIKGDNVKKVDTEGTAIGKSTVRDDTIKISATTGTGAGIGALAGGPVGAAVGASLGAAFGVGAVIIERGKHVKLNEAQQLRVKTSYEVKIR